MSCSMMTSVTPASLRSRNASQSLSMITGDEEAAGGRLQGAADDAGQGRFASAIGAENRDRLPIPDAEVDAVEHARLAVARAYPLELQQRRGRLRALRSDKRRERGARPVGRRRRRLGGLLRRQPFANGMRG